MRTRALLFKDFSPALNFDLIHDEIKRLSCILIVTKSTVRFLPPWVIFAAAALLQLSKLRVTKVA
jgi:hypothetical protein